MAADMIKCSNYIFISDLRDGFIGLGKDNCKAKREIFKFLYLMRLILEVDGYQNLEYFARVSVGFWCTS